MTRADLERWLDAYRRAWEERDPDGAAGLFTPEATYAETPFDDPAVGQAAIRRYWADNTSVQEEVRFSHDVLAIEGDRAVVRWRAELRRVPSGVRSALDGIFLLGFAADGRCSSLLEWWHRQDR